MLHRPCLAALAALLILSAVPAPAGAQVPSVPPPAAAAPPVSDDPYTVSGVEVDITAASAAEARDKAVLEGQRKAFTTLFKRLAADAATRVPPSVGDADLQRMIQGFEIERERGSAVRYVGSLSFKFRRKAVRGYLANLGVDVVEPAPRAAAPAAPAAPTASTAPTAPAAAPAAPPVGVKPTLVLPVGQGRAGYLLWEERTPWRTAWEDFAAAAGAARVVIPPGDLSDVADVGAREAVAGDPASLAKIAAHYDAGDVVVALLPGGERLDPVAGGQVQLSHYGADGRPEGSAETVPVTGAAGEAPAAFLGRAVSAVVDRLASAPGPAAAPAAPPPPAAESQLLVAVPITGMQDWLEVRRRLTSNPMVLGVDTLSLTRSRVDVTLRFRGEQDGLRAMLDRDSLTLAQSPTGWALYLKSAATAPAPRPAPAPAPLAPTPLGAGGGGGAYAPAPVPPYPSPYPPAGGAYAPPPAPTAMGRPGYPAPMEPSEYDPESPPGEEPPPAYVPQAGPQAGRGGYPGYPAR